MYLPVGRCSHMGTFAWWVALRPGSSELEPAALLEDHPPLRDLCSLRVVLAPKQTADFQSGGFEEQLESGHGPHRHCSMKARGLPMISTPGPQADSTNPVCVPRYAWAPSRAATTKPSTNTISSTPRRAILFPLPFRSSQARQRSQIGRGGCGDARLSRCKRTRVAACAGQRLCLQRGDPRAWLPLKSPLPPIHFTFQIERRGAA